MKPLQNCIGPTIRIGREILCLPYAGFFCNYLVKYVKILSFYLPKIVQLIYDCLILVLCYTCLVKITF